MKENVDDMAIFYDIICLFAMEIQIAFCSCFHCLIVKYILES